MNDIWKNRNVLIIGAARQGLALARYLASQGAMVTLNDNRSIEQLGTVIHQMTEYPIQWALGGHPLELLDHAELVCLSGGVALDLPIVEESLRRNIKITNDSQIFMETVPCPVIGITGSSGKTTTTSLVGIMAQLAAKNDQKAWVGGNIGTPLIDQVHHIHEKDLVVLELSSFQLELMSTSPAIAAVTNITPNHLDRHKTLQSYTAAKAHIVAYQKREDQTILNRDDPGSWALRLIVNGNLSSFGFSPLKTGEEGTVCIENKINLVQNKTTQTICTRNEIPLRGDHNVMNTLAACAIGAAAGFSVETMRQAILEFQGVPHRLEWIREVNGAQWYNDSIATAPERTIAAIQSFEEPIVLLLGGKDKELPWERLAQLVHQKVDHVVIFGAAAEKIMNALGPVRLSSRPYSITMCSNLQQAVEAANTIAQTGDVVLLSPGGTSYDEFKDFEERGEKFRLWVQQL
jgi:UDP-N-acetylmuramoylalanine--D-glutamate ligase